MLAYSNGLSHLVTASSTEKEPISRRHEFLIINIINVQGWTSPCLDERQDKGIRSRSSGEVLIRLVWGIRWTNECLCWFCVSGQSWDHFYLYCPWNQWFRVLSSQSRNVRGRLYVVNVNVVHVYFRDRFFSL